MFRRFLRDVRGNYAILTGVAIIPILGAVAVGVDYTEMSRQRQDTLNALDASCIATARKILEGSTSDADTKAYSRKFFDANLGSTDPAKVDLVVQLPTSNVGGGKVELDATLRYQPHFLPPFRALIGASDPNGNVLTFTTASTCQLKNTVEVSLVLDNSGSMADKGKGSGQKKIDLLKSAASQLVDQLAATAAIMKQVDKPVQFSVVPFAASVNIGASNATAAWMDTTGISPIHHENFDWTTMPATMQIKQLTAGGPYYKKGTGWGAADGQIFTRFTLFNDLKRTSCSGSNCTLQPYASWGGCVESRPYPYNTDDTAATTTNPSTLYVPMFAPDESDSASAYNSWWSDVTSSSSALTRQRYAYKYYASQPKVAAATADDGPNGSCTTAAITPLTDVTTTDGLATVKGAISAMQPNGATNVPEGLAWGWRTLSSAAPFTGGRAETERGNDKVVIVLTDGANTYYTPSSLGYADSAGDKSIYSAYGYARLNDGTTPGRIFSGTSSAVNKTSFANSTYTAAMNEQFTATCKNANGGDTGAAGAGLIIMTVALDLDSTDADESKQISLLQSCASRSRYAKDPTDPTKGKKLFWNATGSNLSQVFKEIADELSNLRIVG